MLHVGASNDATYTNIIYMGFSPKNTILLCCTVYHKHCISQTCVHAHAHTPSTVYHTHECTVYHKHVYTHTHEDIWYLVLVCNVFRIWCNVIYSAARVTNMCTRTRTHTKTFDILYSYDMSMFMFSMCIASDIWYLVLVWSVVSYVFRISCNTHEKHKHWLFHQRRSDLLYCTQARKCVHACARTHPDNIWCCVRACVYISCMYMIYYHTSR